MLVIKTYLKKKAPRVWLRIIFWPTRWWNNQKKLAPASRCIFMTIGDTRKNGDIPRHIYSVARYFADAGANIYIYQKLNFQFFEWLKRYGRKLFSIPNVKFVSDIPQDTESMIYMFDHENLDEAVLSWKWKKLVYLSIRKPKSWDVGVGAIDMPYVIYPGIHLDQKKELAAHRGQGKRVRVFFAGNMDRVYYKNPILNKFNQMSRRKAISVVLSARKQIIYKPGLKEFNRLIDGNMYQNIGVITDFSKFKIPEEKWLDAVARSHFFLCFSGTDYPMCHHLIEAIMVGTIPIMSYPEWMNPPLEHGKNALIYRSPAELLERFNEAMTMSADRMEQMRQNTIRYYEEHLSPKSFFPKFDAFPGPHTLGLHRRAFDRDPDDHQSQALGGLRVRLADYYRSTYLVK